MTQKYEVLVEAILLSDPDALVKKYSPRPMMEWCEKNKINFTMKHAHGFRNWTMSFEFTTKNDAMFFKLVWG